MEFSQICYDDYDAPVYDQLYIPLTELGIDFNEQLKFIEDIGGDQYYRMVTMRRDRLTPDEQLVLKISDIYDDCFLT